MSNDVIKLFLINDIKLYIYYYFLNNFFFNFLKIFFFIFFFLLFFLKYLSTIHFLLHIIFTHT